MRFLFVPLIVFFQSALVANERFEFEEQHMGVPVRIILYASDSDAAHAAAKDAFAAFQSLNKIMSDYDSDSELSRLCSHGGSPKVSEDLFTVLCSAKKYCALSNGAFDITVGPMVRLWRRSRRQHELPKQQYVDAAKELVGNHLWELDEQARSVRLLKQNMKLDLGGIAKGYAIDKAFGIIQKHRITSLLIDAGGDLRVGNPPPNEKGWKIAQSGKTILMSNTALATSGGQFQVVVLNGVRYAHIIDPKTGLGISGERSQQTIHITAPTAMEADILASAVAVLGKEKGNSLLATLPNVSMKIVPLENPHSEKTTE